MVADNFKFIAHRGNTKGRSSNENNPAYVIKALKKGFDAEVDVWYIDNNWYLGHDTFKYPVEIDFLLQQGLWCHAKNILALYELLNYKVINCFWHEDDSCTCTSHGFIWSFSGCKMTKRSICVFAPDEKIFIPEDCAGICCDDVERMNREYSYTDGR